MRTVRLIDMSLNVDMFADSFKYNEKESGSFGVHCGYVLIYSILNNVRNFAFSLVRHFRQDNIYNSNTNVH